MKLVLVLFLHVQVARDVREWTWKRSFVIQSETQGLLVTQVYVVALPVKIFGDVGE